MKERGVSEAERSPGRERDVIVPPKHTESRAGDPSGFSVSGPSGGPAPAPSSASPVPPPSSVTPAPPRSSLTWPARATWGFVALGAALRLEHWLSGRSLWLDEASLALNLLDRGPGALLAPLDHMQTSPYGFLLLEKLALAGFGPGERSLRLVAFLSGLAGLVLFRHLALRILPAAGAAVAVGLFALGGILVHYSAELKPYSTDVAVTVLLTIGWVGASAGRLGPARAAALGLLGAAAVWLSFPAPLVIAGLALPPLAAALREPRRGRAAELLAAAAVPAASFGLWFALAGRELLGDEVRRAQFALWYPPLDAPVDAARWLLAQGFEVFRMPAGLPLTGLAALAFLLGLVELGGRRRMVALQLVLPLALALVVAALRVYPFHGRLLLFAVPSILLLVGAGARAALGWSREATPRERSAAAPKANRAAARAAGPLLVGLLFLHPLAFAADNLLGSRGYGYEDLRPLLRTLGERSRPGDTVYLHGPEGTPFAYYSRIGLVAAEDLDVVRGRQFDVGEYTEELRLLRGRPRVWVLASRADLADEEPAFLALLDTTGCRLEAFESEGAGLYLYDFRQPIRQGRARPDGTTADEGRDACR